MAKQIEIMRQPRIKILSILETFSLDQLNIIPAGFNNNILWNLGHMIAAQQGVCYKRAGLDTWVSDSFFQAYKPDTKPEGYISEEQFDEIKELLMTSLDQLETDLHAGIFTNYPAWTTRYGAEIRDINDAIAFLPFHEGLHVGYIMGLRKLV
ncbi:DinB family protein [Mucilaginibacter psychrotolerans]|uniref:DinB family protein n=1 Tax=Mucilaginibacter psychrotolerans TaxID=1524096 RepID=A0A4Y8SQX3_9SPHI|nr:DinB family protein [Mucilaginibacter psychrotolerans]